MVKTLTSISLAIWLVCCFVPGVCAGIVVNEVMANEPGSLTTREWIELFNNSQQPIPIADVLIVHANDTVSFTSSYAIQPQEHIVVTRSVIAFEDVWGDRSGVWGDTPAESFTLFSGSFSLPNQADSVSALWQGNRSTLLYPDGGADGVSWERVLPDSSVALQSIDPSGSSPGRVNSVSPPLNNLNVRFLNAHSEFNFSTTIKFVVENNGQNATLANTLNVYANPVVDSVSWTIKNGNLLAQLPVTALEPTNADTLSLSVTLDGLYATIGASLSFEDDRIWDNVTDSLVPGSSFPPLIISEFLPDPEQWLTTEWIEIKNITDSAIGLDGWSVGDELSLSTITNSAVYLSPRGRAILTPDRTRFLSEYTSINADVIEVQPWRALNNTGDLVRLVDSLGYTADSVSYDAGWGANVTWARDESSGVYFPAIWGRSTDVGGSPGQFNYILANALAETIALTVAPNPFSPDGDGFEDEAVFTLASPPGENLTVKIYNRNGSVIRTLTNTTPFSGDVVWDGKTDTGRRVSIGVYIVYVSVDSPMDGTRDFKTTVTVAR